MSSSEARQRYEKARKAALKTRKDLMSKGLDPHPECLEDVMNDIRIIRKENLGVIEIPSGLVTGTVSRARASSFTAGFLPLLEADSEFAAKWISLCRADLSDEGIHDPVECYEYMGRFYVLEGNKRVSVYRSFDAPLITARVTRLVPAPARDGSDEAYRAFLEHYRLCRLYCVQFSSPEKFARLRQLAGLDGEHVWNEEERRRFSSLSFRFFSALEAVCGPMDIKDMSDLFLEAMRQHGTEVLRRMGPGRMKELAASMTGRKNSVAGPLRLIPAARGVISFFGLERFLRAREALKSYLTAA